MVESSSVVAEIRFKWSNLVRQLLTKGENTKLSAFKGDNGGGVIHFKQNADPNPLNRH